MRVDWEFTDCADDLATATQTQWEKMVPSLEKVLSASSSPEDAELHMTVECDVPKSRYHVVAELDTPDGNVCVEDTGKALQPVLDRVADELLNQAQPQTSDPSGAA